MKVSKSVLVELFQALGKPNAPKWPTPLFVTQANALLKLKEAEVAETLADEEDCLKVYQEIVKALKKGEKIELVTDDAPARAGKKGAKETPAKKGKAAKQEEPDDEDEDEDEEEEDEEEEDDEDEEEESDDEDEEEEGEEPVSKPGKKGAKASGGTAVKEKKAHANKGKAPERVGIISEIEARLRKGTKEKPVSRAQILEHLKKKFPDRDEKGMKSTISIQVPRGLIQRKNLDVKGDKDKGFWLK